VIREEVFMELWEELFTDLELTDIEDMWAEGYSIDQIYEVFYNFHKPAIVDGTITGEQLYKAIKSHIRDMYK
jgi:hypothetical protein